MKIGRSLSRPKPRTRSKKAGEQAAIMPLDEAGVVGRVVALAALVPLGQGQGVGLPQGLAGLVVVAAGVEHLGQAEVQGAAPAFGQVGVGQQPAHGRQVGVGQLAAQQRRQLRVGAGQVRVEPQRRAQAAAPRP